MDKVLLTLLACPLCKGELHYRRNKQELVCVSDQLAYPIRSGIPIMLINAARKLDKKEVG